MVSDTHTVCRSIDSDLEELNPRLFITWATLRQTFTSLTALSMASELDNTLVPPTPHLSMKEILAAHIQVHLLFSPDQQETWTLLERKFPRATEKEFNAAVAALEMDDVISIDPHPHFPSEYLIKIDYPPEMARPEPLPFPGFHYPILDTPLGTGVGTGSEQSSSTVSETQTPAKMVHFLPGSSHRSSSTKRTRRSSSGTAALAPVEDIVKGLWSHTPPRLRDALGEADNEEDEDHQADVGVEGDDDEASKVAKNDIFAKNAVAVADMTDGRELGLRLHLGGKEGDGGGTVVA